MDIKKYNKYKNITFKYNPITKNNDIVFPNDKIITEYSGININQTQSDGIKKLPINSTTHVNFARSYTGLQS